MGRHKRDPAPFWWAARDCYYIQIGKRQIKLDPDLDTATLMAHKILSEPLAPPKQVLQRGVSPLVLNVLEQFLDWMEANRAAPTYRANKERLHFISSLKEHGDLESLMVDELKPFHVTRVVTAKGKSWSDNFRHDIMAAPQRAMNWARE